ncbi:hypothetical protein ACO2Q0_02865 [Phenylobacterium sp. VNQ135]|uniref:hypothetical protein n=1 Tax=Phenylobacterium sp. VNQ135 TaxID=3400922 RepID=UPI003C002A4E
MSEATVTRLPRAGRTPSVADLIREAQAEVLRLSDTQRQEFISAIERACALASEVSDNPAQPVGVRDLARRFIDDEQQRVSTILSIINRS